MTEPKSIPTGYGWWMSHLLIRVSSATTGSDSSRSFHTRPSPPPGRSTRANSARAAGASNQWKAWATVTASTVPSPTSQLLGRAGDLRGAGHHRGEDVPHGGGGLAGHDRRRRWPPGPGSACRSRRPRPAPDARWRCRAPPRGGRRPRRSSPDGPARRAPTRWRIPSDRAGPCRPARRRRPGGRRRPPRRVRSPPRARCHRRDRPPARAGATGGRSVRYRRGVSAASPDPDHGADVPGRPTGAPPGADAAVPRGHPPARRHAATRRPPATRPEGPTPPPPARAGPRRLGLDGPPRRHRPR